MTPRNRSASAPVLLALLLAALSGVVAAATPDAGGAILSFSATPAAGGGQNYSVPVQTLLFFTVLAFIPAIILMMTGFTRIIIVLSLLRQALGTQTTPPNQVLIGLSLFLTLFVMGPVIDKVYTDAYQPYTQQKIGLDEAIARGEGPLKGFMLKQVREPDLALFVRMARYQGARTAEELPLRIIVPAFVTSELKTAFQIGFMIFIPFLIIDMVVASVLMSMGMMMV